MTGRKREYASFGGQATPPCRAALFLAARGLWAIHLAVANDPSMRVGQAHIAQENVPDPHDGERISNNDPSCAFSARHTESVGAAPGHVAR